MRFELITHQVSSRVSSDFIGVLLHESESTYIYMEPLIYLWWKKQASAPIQDFPLFEFNKSTVRTTPQQTIFEAEEWLLEFPTQQHTAQDLSYCLIFFTTFILHHQEPMTIRLEKTIELTRTHIPFYLLQPLVLFVFEHSQQDRDRIRLLLSETINKYIRSSD